MSHVCTVNVSQYLSLLRLGVWHDLLTTTCGSELCRILQSQAFYSISTFVKKELKITQIKYGGNIERYLLESDYQAYNTLIYTIILSVSSWCRTALFKPVVY